MAKATQAIKVKITVAVPVNLTSMRSMSDAATSIERMRQYIADCGGEVIEMTSATGKHEFAPKVEAEGEGDQGDQGDTTADTTNDRSDIGDDVGRKPKVKG